MNQPRQIEQKIIHTEVEKKEHNKKKATEAVF